MELNEIVEEIVCVNYSDDFQVIVDALMQRFDNEDTNILGQIMVMAEDKYLEIKNDLYEFWDD